VPTLKIIIINPGFVIVFFMWGSQIVNVKIYYLYDTEKNRNFLCTQLSDKECIIKTD